MTNNAQKPATEISSDVLNTGFIVAALKAREERMLLVDKGIRIERMVWLAGLNEEFSDPDFFDDIDYVFEEPHPSLQWLKDAPDWALLSEKDLIHFIGTTGRKGIMALVEVQCPHNYQANGSYHSSWGASLHKWMYAEKPKDFIPMALAFREDIHARAKLDAGLGKP